MKRSTIYTLVLSASLFIWVPQLLSQNAPPSENTRNLLKKLIEDKWGTQHTRLPSATVLVQYESDLGERWIVDFESGSVTLESLWEVHTSLDDPIVQRDMACAVSNLYVSIPVMPELMIEEQQKAGGIIARTVRNESAIYAVQKGDTLSEIAIRMRVPVAAIMKVNNLSNPDRICINQKLTIPPSPPHMHLPGEKHQTASESILLNQLVDPESGEKINADNVGAFGQRLVKKNGVESELIQGADGRTRKLARIKLTLAERHLQIRAKKYYPLIQQNAKRFGHDPALIMAMVHTESAFNPMASSSANAYGLMQLVPSSGAREAYRWLHRKDIKPSPAYLLQPGKNIELGSAYMQLLQDRIFSGVKNTQSRLYCAVAAYNGGGGNVGRTFSGRKSVQASVNKINAKSPDQVLSTLKKSAPHKETRDYMERVFQRIALYRQPQWQ